ncbi:glycerol dehydrogenase [Fructilactobacillus cliffordii]|uniref:Glycerol dehydrogenase n=1 Tax=Fructilactobacillus cliffordii TaxID=2940299 RepID=A0A9Q8ZT71_9LACO|nr:glycerol dehydrogenase [Fructilactobacillus cliffordii]USS89189.1 glycerol dehydrogenase [Fructilactobacillus cliffordii]
MVAIFASPSRYIQGKDVFLNAHAYLDKLGKHVLLISSDNIMTIVGNQFRDDLEQHGFQVTCPGFHGEASDEEIERLVKAGQQADYDLIVGLGGGKTVDTAKNVANQMNVKVACLPTTASTDAPCSALSVIYNEDGTFKNYSFYDQNPDLVLVDTNVIAHAPVRTLISGLGDAMATNVEAQDVAKAHANSMVRGSQTSAALAIAEKCMDNLFAYSAAAIAAAKAQSVTPALETITETNTLLSGLGFESAGLAAAHAIYDAFTVLPGESQTMLHGEKVAYGTLCELVLDNAPYEKLDQFIDYFQAVGLPTTLKDLHMDNFTESDFLEVGKQATIPSETIHNMPMDVSAEDVVAAILTVNHYVLAKDKH